uniref:Uncharacterized protein n=1 Tax=Setaria viridis TaxID=4556 RepID=A0A4U6VAW0_SETVI|nr:hypothetical protein SEVIR_4G186400v2 [Setaria viridis]
MASAFSELGPALSFVTNLACWWRAAALGPGSWRRTAAFRPRRCESRVEGASMGWRRSPDVGFGGRLVRGGAGGSRRRWGGARAGGGKGGYGGWNPRRQEPRRRTRGVRGVEEAARQACTAVISRWWSGGGGVGELKMV